MNILVVVAHPDDEVLGMGGTLLKHAQKGDKIRILFLATGITSRRSIDSSNPNLHDDVLKNKMFKKQIETLKSDSKKSCKLLSITDLHYYDFPDNEMDSVPLLHIVKTIENQIQSFKPKIVYTTHYNDLNIDHRTVFQATLTACRPINSTVKELISFEVPSSTEWNYPSKFNPNFFINIESQISKKIQAAKLYKNEMRVFPHPRSPKYLKSLAEKWGGASGYVAAEAFEIIRKFES